jgi:hypothetical protein
VKGMVKRGIQNGPCIAELLTTDLRAAGLLPTRYRVVSRRVASGPICVLYLACGDEGEGVYVGFDYDTAWRAVEASGAEEIWRAHTGRPDAH